MKAYQYGMGLFAFISRMELLLAPLAIVKVVYDKWLEFVIPLVTILTVFTMIMLTISVYS